eukprot:scaffold7504_cov121-Isochrysis_galbana.AAC.7
MRACVTYQPHAAHPRKLSGAGHSSYANGGGSHSIALPQWLVSGHLSTHTRRSYQCCPCHDSQLAAARLVSALRCALPPRFDPNLPARPAPHAMFVRLTPAGGGGVRSSRRGSTGAGQRLLGCAPLPAGSPERAQHRRGQVLHR